MVYGSNWRNENGGGSLDEKRIAMKMSVDLKKQVECQIVLQSNRLSNYAIIYFNLIKCMRAITSRPR